MSEAAAMTKTLLSLGHGYSAAALARRLLPQGWRIIGTTRSAEKALALARTGVEPLIWPGSDPGAALASASHILSSIAPDQQGDPVVRALGPALAAARPEWVGYLSTTAVYGDHQGGWVDETTPLTPSTMRGRQRVAAEAEWQALAATAGWSLNVFRLAGIYGPEINGEDRGPFAKVRAGLARRIIKPGQVFSRIHVEDIARAIEAAMQAPRAGAVWNLCDDDPAPPEDVIACAAAMLNLPLPPAEAFDTAQMTPMARSFYAENKRVRNDRIKAELGFQLLYPDYRKGLAGLLSQG